MVFLAKSGLNPIDYTTINASDENVSEMLFKKFIYTVQV